ncbi:MAG: sigma-70 family RNA polymerase sigma factor [Gemmatimonadaceae bacterium]
MRSAIAALPPTERQVLSLYYFEELKLSEIAVILGVSESRVSQIRGRAVLRLRDAMGSLREAVA